MFHWIFKYRMLENVLQPCPDKNIAIRKAERLRTKKQVRSFLGLVEFYGVLVYRLRKIVGKSNFSEQFRKRINRYKRIGYNPYVMRQTACLVLT